ncbi:MAG: KEOPS complex subunit Pcc1 [Nitrososphaerota archaeon]
MIEKAKAKIIFNISEKEASIILKSLLPEIKNPATNRSKIDLLIRDGKLLMNVEAKDMTALRAALNSYVRWINMIIETLGVIEENE